jgi:urease accessory protein
MNTLVLLHLCDSLFPIGAFGYSDGLETATSTGLVQTADDLRAWLEICLEESFGRVDGPAIRQACAAFDREDWPTLDRLDGELTALRPSATARHSSRAMGLRLVTTWHLLYPHPGLEQVLHRGHVRGAGIALPVAFACACTSAGIDALSAAAAFAYTRLASTISAAMRLMPVGQTLAHQQLAAVLGRVPMVLHDMTTDAGAGPFIPAMDIALMAQPYLASRLFRS